MNDATQAATSANQRLAQAGIKLSAADLSDATDEGFSWAAGKNNRTILATDGWQGTLLVRETASRETPDHRWASAALVAGLFAVAWLILRIPLVRDFLAAQAPAIVAAAGIGWSLLAPWPWLGWIAVGLAIWLAIRLPRMRHFYS